MTNFIPVFPLEIVVFPEEKLNLHIFEPRYKQMIQECVVNKKPFGLPPVFNKRPAEYGTLMEITEVVKVYDNGEMDIRTRGVSVFKTLEFMKEIPEKLFSGAIVTYPDNVMEKGDTQISTLILNEVKRLYALLNLESKFPAEKTSMISYEIGHLVGFSKEQEYEMLQLFTEVQRLEYIRRHLKDIIPTIQELEAMKARIQRNGHFRDLTTGDLNL
ncbi:MAG: LON peptidase substrate-binding domain-containing protein [Flavipsychrobacter sp.]